MALFKRLNAFNPTDLEIIARAYEAAWAEIIARELSRNTSKDEVRKKALRKRIFAMVCYGVSDAATLRDKALASTTEYWVPPS